MQLGRTNFESHFHFFAAAVIYTMCLIEFWPGVILSLSVEGDPFEVLFRFGNSQTLYSLNLRPGGTVNLSPVFLLPTPYRLFHTLHSNRQWFKQPQCFYRVTPFLSCLCGIFIHSEVRENKVQVHCTYDAHGHFAFLCSKITRCY